MSVTYDLNRRILRRGAIALCAVGLSLITFSNEAQGQIAGAEPPAPKKEATKKLAQAKPVVRAAPAAAQTTPVTSAGGADSVVSVSAGPTIVSTAPATSAPPTATCLPECRSGFVCREGECVSACNPGCAENETCNAKRECVPKTEANEPYPYDKVRLGVGGAIGVSTLADGMGTPFGGLVAISVPLGGHLYTREDVVITYSQTSAEDSYYVGNTVSPAGRTPVDQTYLLVALRATVGYQFSSLMSARAGLFAGSHMLTTRHGFCGNGPAERDENSAALGGTGALAFAFKHADLAVVADGYTANTQQLCSIVQGPLAQPAVLAPQKALAAQILAQATFLF